MEKIIVKYATIEDMAFIVDCQIRMAFETEGMHLDKTTVAQGVKAVFDDPLKGFYLVSTSELDSSSSFTDEIELDGSSSIADETELTKSFNESKPHSCLMVTPEWSDWRNNWVWWIQSVYVIPEMRKAGIFSLMYGYIKTLVTEHTDVAGIRLYVDNTNLSAREVYKRIGMSDEHYRLFEWMK